MFNLFRNRQREAIVSRLYAEILAQARDPALFLDHAVPDTLEGRYDMMVLHVFLVLHRMRDEPPGIKEAAQETCDRFFTEMDRALREMGVGDLAVPKRMKKIAQVYVGAAAAYAAALARPDDAELAAALSRNVYGAAEGIDPHAQPLAAYVRRAADMLEKRPALDLIEKGLVFPRPGLDQPSNGRSAA